MSTEPSRSQYHQQSEADVAGRTPEHHFISYSRRDSAFVKRLAEELHKGRPRFRVWMDQNEMGTGSWTKQIEEAIDKCHSFLLVVSEDSKKSEIVEKELHRAHNGRKLIIPLIKDSQVSLPFLAEGQQYVDFSHDFSDGLDKLRRFLKKQASPDSVPLSQLVSPTIINAPPLISPTYFQGYTEQCQSIKEFLADDARALLWISGRAGSGKTALACRVLEQIRSDGLAGHDRRIDIDAIVYVGQERQDRSLWVKCFNELRRLVGTEAAAELKRPREGSSYAFEFQNLLTQLSNRRVVLLLDHLDDIIEMETRQIKGQYLQHALQALLATTTHRWKVIATSQVLPKLPKAPQSRWSNLNLVEGLPRLDALQLLRELDHDGTLGLRDGVQTLLAELCRRTQDNPRAIESLHTVLVRDRATTPKDILRDEKHFLPAEVLDALIGKSYAGLDNVSKVVMQVLSVTRDPVTADAVAVVFHRYLPDIDPRPILSRLLNRQLVKRKDEWYHLQEADQWYVASQLAEDTSIAKDETGGTRLAQSTLHKHWATYFQKIGPSSELKLDMPECTVLCSEFHHRYAAREYAAAFDVLVRLERQLSTPTCYTDLAQRYEQLNGKLGEVDLERRRLDALAGIYHRLGELDRAAVCYEEGLKCVRHAHDRRGECRYLSNLAICKQESGDLIESTLYCMAALDMVRQTGDGVSEAHIWNIIGEVLASLGQIHAAIQASECALRLARKNDQREIEVVALVNLGQHQEALGNGERADRECNRAYEFAEKSQFQLGKAAARRNLGVLDIGDGRYKQASRHLTEAMLLADVTQSELLQQSVRVELAAAQLLGGKPSDAEVTIGEAIKFDTRLFSPEAFSLRGIILQQLGKAHEAIEPFHRALNQAEVILKRTPRYYRALDVMGLSYSGLTLSEDTDEYLDKAIEAYEAARLITNEPGIVRRRLLLFNALAQIDSGGKLASVRNVIDLKPS